MFLRGGEPYSVIPRAGGFVAQNKNGLVLHVHSETPEHRVGIRRKRGNRVERELMGRWLALLACQKGMFHRNRRVPCLEHNHVCERDNRSCQVQSFS